MILAPQIQQILERLFYWMRVQWGLLACLRWCDLQEGEEVMSKRYLGVSQGSGVIGALPLLPVDTASDCAAAHTGTLDLTLHLHSPLHCDPKHSRLQPILDEWMVLRMRMRKGLHSCLQAEISVMQLNGSTARCVPAHPYWLLLA